MASMNPIFFEQAGLEVMPSEAGLYPLPARMSPSHEPLPKGRPANPGFGDAQQTAAEPEDQMVKKNVRKRILGLSVPVFWVVIVLLFIILGAAIGGGVAGGLIAQQQKSSSESSHSRTDEGDTGGSDGSTRSSTAPMLPTASTPTTADTLVPTDGCPGVHSVAYTPYSADGKPIPLRAGDAPQQFQEQCWTNWANTGSTHDILRTYTPTLENCITVCAEYNKAYLRNLKGNTGVGGGFCVAVTIVKEHAGFCYLKNGTESNNTMGDSAAYSSARLLTSLDDFL